MAWLGLVVIQIARAAGSQSGFNWPEPRLLVAPAVIYSGLSLVAAVSPELAVALGAGFDVAAVLDKKGALMAPITNTMSRIVGVSNSGAQQQPAQQPGAKSSTAPPIPVESGGGRLSMQS